MDRLTSMSVFARVAAQRSFSAAARELGISQATASKHVQMLEAWLGTKLLNRTTRRVGLTDAGEAFYSQCTRILEDLEDAQLAGRPEARLRGSLRFTAPVAFGTVRLAPILVEAMRDNPELLLTVTLCDRPVDVIEEGYDLAIHVETQPPRLADDSALVVHPLGSMPFAVCAAPAYLAANGTPVVPGDLSRHSCVTDSRHPGDRWHFTGPGGDIEVAVSGGLRTDNGLLRREAARNGGGILLAPEFLVAEDVAGGRLVRLLPGFAPRAARLEAMCSAQRAASPKVRGFITYLTARLGAEGRLLS